MGVGTLPTRMGLIDRAVMSQETLSLLSDFFETAAVDPNPAGRAPLPLRERQLVELAKALHRSLDDADPR